MPSPSPPRHSRDKKHGIDDDSSSDEDRRKSDKPSTSRKDSELKHEEGDKPIFRGPDGGARKFNPEELKKITVMIKRTLPKIEQPSIERSIVNPDTIAPIRRSDEGKKPIFQREELSTTVYSSDDDSRKGSVERDKSHKYEKRSRDRYSRSRERSRSSHRRRHHTPSPSRRHRERRYSRDRRYSRERRQSSERRDHNRREDDSWSRRDRHKRYSSSPSPTRQRRSRSYDADKYRDREEDRKKHKDKHDDHKHVSRSNEVVEYNSDNPQGGPRGPRPPYIPRPRMRPPMYRAPPMFPVFQPVMFPHPGFVPFRPPRFPPRF